MNKTRKTIFQVNLMDYIKKKGLENDDPYKIASDIMLEALESEEDHIADGEEKDIWSIDIFHF